MAVLSKATIKTGIDPEGTNLKPVIKKILVANRGEIAIRAMRAANELGIQTVAVYAEQDKMGLHRFKSDEAYLIGAGMGPVAAYLSIEEMIRVAKASGADAIHPGYGLLSENPDFVDACHENGIIFIGPKAEIMRALGDKASARKVAIEAGVPVIPASEVLGEDYAEIAKQAAEIGYPLMLKASWGGGGRGMRRIDSEDELEAKIREGRSESEAAFGNGESYLEKMIIRARHVEVQILGDKHGNIYHLFERDCSVQRRNQKVVERAPAPYLTEAQRQQVCAFAKQICTHVRYECAGTVEFLMDMDTDEFYFIEVNPRVQVEHTVTEEVTNIDIVRAQILLAQGDTLAEATGHAEQDTIQLQGHALQTRITTEDPQNNFIPDYGRITSYRSASGMGVRLDGGTAYTGAVITRFYDSLLVKVSTHAQTPENAIARMQRALSEFRIRGVSTNIPFIKNLLQHEGFLSGQYSTRFIDETPDLFDFQNPQDRASKILEYLAEISVNGNAEIGPNQASRISIKEATAPVLPEQTIQPGVRQILEADGAAAVVDWVKSRSEVLLTDTTMRDAHQSLLATRMRSIDMLHIADAYAKLFPNLFSVECWGGATFDVAYRFLHECPWQRLRDLREAMPNLMPQMLLRASNAVGYTNYPDNVVQSFIAQAAESGVDVFRVFDSLNWVENMRVAMDSVIESGKICEGTICYTGDLFDKSRDKYNLDYYLSMAKDLTAAGAQLIGLKDMAGLLKPAQAKMLIEGIKSETNVPIHFHTHDTSGAAVATVIAACNAGVDIVDAAFDAMSGGTSQPCLGSIVEALRFTDRDAQIEAKNIAVINRYWEQVRAQYHDFESGLEAPASEVYKHEMPGGQFTNLKAQAKSMGLESRWSEVASAYQDANQIFGDIVKVTPSSKVVGDMALMMVTQNLSRADVEDPDCKIAFPESVVDMLRGNLGQPVGGFPSAISAKALGDIKPILCRPGELLGQEDIAARRKELIAFAGDEPIDNEDLNGYLMYPKVFKDYLTHHAKYGPVRTLPTTAFFYGMRPGESISVEIDKGKVLEITCLTISEANKKGVAKVFFELNGQPRVVSVRDQSVSSDVSQSLTADPNNENHVGAPMPGMIASVEVKEGQTVSKDDVVMVIEAMKMEMSIRAERDGTIAKLHVAQSDQIDVGDLMYEFA